MLSTIAKAYDGGWRAGMAEKKLVPMPNGTKRVAEPENPYTGRFQWAQRMAWGQGYRNGVMRAFYVWQAKREGRVL